MRGAAKTVLAVAATLSAVMITAGPAAAGSGIIHSGLGSTTYFDDNGDWLTVCDNRAGDGVAAKGYFYANGEWRAPIKVYNGCATEKRDIQAEAARVWIEICDLYDADNQPCYGRWISGS